MNRKLTIIIDEQDGTAPAVHVLQAHPTLPGRLLAHAGHVKKEDVDTLLDAAGPLTDRDLPAKLAPPSQVPSPS